jgi:hypothetical protein
MNDVADAEDLASNPATTIKGLREAYWTRRQMLLGRAERRRKWQRALHLASGIVTLASGVVTALLTATNLAAGIKLAATAITFISGGVSLWATTYFDSKETQKIADGAAEYGALIDILDNLRDRIDDLQPKTIKESLKSVRDKAASARQRTDPYLPSGKKFFDEAKVLAELLKLFPDLTRHITHLLR